MFSEFFELSLIGGLLKMNNYDKQVGYCELMTPEHFNHTKTKNYFRLLKEIIRCGNGSPIDFFHFLGQCESLGLKDVHMDIQELNNPSLDIFDVEQNIRLKIEDFYKSQLASRANQAAKEILKARNADMADELKESLISDLVKLEFLPNKKTNNSRIETRETISSILNEEELEGYSTGIVSLDVLMGGLKPQRLVVVGALKKSGKTRFIIHLRKQLYKQGIVSPFLSLEMTVRDITKLTISNHLGINGYAFENKGLLSESQKQSIARLDEELNWDLYPNEFLPNPSVETIISKIKHYAKLNPRCVIFIDYLQRVKYSSTNSAGELADIANRIADATREYEVCVVLLSQLSNTAEDKSQDIGIGNLKGSGGIAEAADTIIIMDNKQRKSGMVFDKGLFDFQLTQRHCSGGTIKIEADLSTCQFADIGCLEEVELMEINT